MGKSHKVKAELLDVSEMYNLIQTLKDIADNKLYTLLAQKEKFRRFGETFVEFFRMISLTKTKHLLIGNANPKVGIVVITIEGSFLGEFNNKIVRSVLKEKSKYPQVEFIAIGNRSVDWLSKYTPNMKTFTNMESVGIYETAIQVKEYIINEVMNGRLGKIMVAWSWPKTIDTQKPRVTKLLPCEDLVVKQSQFVSEFENVIEESSPAEVIGYLCNLWVTTRLFEMLMDTNIAAAAAQAAFLEESVDKMKKERIKTRMKYRKARKNDIDKSLRETFSARMISAQQAVIN